MTQACGSDHQGRVSSQCMFRGCQDPHHAESNKNNQFNIMLCTSVDTPNGPTYILQQINHTLLILKSDKIKE